MTAARGAAFVTVHVNGEDVRVPVWSRWRDAVAAWDGKASTALVAGEGLLEDASGQPVDPDGAVVPGGSLTFRRVGA